LDGPIRIVEIADFDVNPCGGTHVARTGEIGLLRISNIDYRGDETRVEFLCGGRVLHDYRAKSAVINSLATRLTVGYWELDQAVERLQGETKQLRHDLRQARQRLVHADAVDLFETSELEGAYRVVRRVWDGLDPSELRALAQELVHHFETVVLLASVAERTHLCFACSSGLDLDMASVLRSACSLLDGKGGGQSHFAQGSVATIDLAHVRHVISTLPLD
jgi:alanyl-tRNA synthetase